MSTSFNPRTREVKLYQGDDEQRMQDLAADVERAKKTAKDDPARLLHEIAPLDAAIAAHDEFIVAADKRAMVVTVKALGRKQWRSLVAEHKPREGHPGDEAVGVNEESLADALVPISILEPTFDTPADRDEFLDSLSDAQYELLYLNAFSANRSMGGAPKALGQPSPSSSEIGN